MADGPNTPTFYMRGRPGLDSEVTWGNVSRYDRRAEVVAPQRLTKTGTVRISFRVTDDHPFVFSPGQWIGLEEEVPGFGFRRSPYCIFSPPTDDGRFELLIRILPDGPLSLHLAELPQGYIVKFRGPRGRNMLPKAGDRELILVATGVGIAPLYSLIRHLESQGEQRRIRLYWGLRMTDDICLLDELDEIATRMANFSYQISLSQPPAEAEADAEWPHLRGRVTESVPPLLETLAGKRFCLSGNGAMIEELEMALCSLGVDRTSIHEERFFNLKHKADRATMDIIRARFMADDLLSAHAQLLNRVWQAARPESPAQPSKNATGASGV